MNTAIAAADPPMMPCAMSISFVRSNMSARAPAAREMNSRGKVAEATIIPTQALDPVSSNISHEAATF